jgi:hypothetical protein
VFEIDTTPAYGCPFPFVAAIDDHAAATADSGVIERQMASVGRMRPPTHLEKRSTAGSLDTSRRNTAINDATPRRWRFATLDQWASPRTSPG